MPWRDDDFACTRRATAQHGKQFYPQKPSAKARNFAAASPRLVAAAAPHKPLRRERHAGHQIGLVAGISMAAFSRILRRPGLSMDSL